MNRTCRIGPETFCIGFFGDSAPLSDSNVSGSCETQPNCGTVFTIATALLSSLSLLFVGMVALFGPFYVVARQPCGAGTNTYPLLYSLFCFKELTLGRMPRLTR